MKLFYVLLFLCLLCTNAQRRGVQKTDPADSEAASQRPTGRGRARFSLFDLGQDTVESSGRLAARRKPVVEERHARPPAPPPPSPELGRRDYEVEEVVDEAPLDTKKSKSRVLTEMRFEAQNAPVNPLFLPATPLSSQEAPETTDAATTTVLDFITDSMKTDALTSSELPRIANEIKKNPETTAASSRRETTRRMNARTRTAPIRSEEPSTTPAAPRRSRTRPPKKSDEPSSTTPPARSRSGRRRPDPTRGPSVFVAEESQNGRSRTGRKIIASKKPAQPERISLDLPVRSRNAPAATAATSTNRRSDVVRPKPRSRFRDVPPVIDEQKLEVLPLFEAESKTVRPGPRKSVKVVARRRNFNSAEDTVEMSATENDVKTMKPDTSTSRSVKVSRRVETRTESSVQRRKPAKKESVVSKVTEVTSKRTVGRKKTRPEEAKATVTASSTVNRGRQKSEINLKNVKKKPHGLSSSEEDINESDNYPAPFKALLQAKKHNKESSSTVAITRATEKVVTSSTLPPSTTTSTAEPPRQAEDADNELEPPRTTRRRFSTPAPEVTTTAKKGLKLVTRKTIVARSTTPRHTTTTTTAATTTTKVHVRPEPTKPPLSKTLRNFSPKPPRGLYSSRKNKEQYLKATSKSPNPTQVPLKKSNRYSSRYRNEISRGAVRTSTNAPAYLPTIPTITPPTTSVKAALALEDKFLGLEVISFDDPINTVPSANLVSSDYLASSTSDPLVSMAQTKTTEKQPISIIERIINSITAISTTTEAPGASNKPTTPVQNESTKASAILKLATKKPTKLDKTTTDQRTEKIVTKQIISMTTEKPTTVIERILSSLSAIQADTTSNTKNLQPPQVGTNFNTISSSATTPLSTRVTKSYLPAQVSTSINPLKVLDEIANDQTVQKRTIGKLLALLNGLTSTTPQTVVVVTPKTSTTTPLFSSPTPNPLRIDLDVTLPPQAIATILPPSPPPTTTTIKPETSTATDAKEAQSTATGTTTVETTISTSTAPTSNTVTPTEGTTASMSSETPSTVTESITQNQETTTGNTIVPNTQSSKGTTVDLTKRLGILSLFFNPDVTSSLTEATPAGISLTTKGSVGVNEAAGFTDTTINPTLGTIMTTVPTTNETVDESSTTATAIETTTGPNSSGAMQTTPSISTTQTTLMTSTTGSTSSPTITTTTDIPVDTNTVLNYPSTIPTMMSFEVSPGSVSVFSANDLSNAITTDDVGTTVTIASRITTTTPESSTIPMVTTDSTESSTLPVTEPTSNNNITQETSNQTANNVSFSNRSGRLLNVVQEPVQNSIETSSPTSAQDYFIFAVLNNNTILRKRPSNIPNRETPYLIVGVYPNNTIVRKYPNGTLVPMEPVIRVSGFDTRENPPPLPEITSNQVTPDQGGQPPQTVDSRDNSAPVEPNPLSINTKPNSVNSAKDGSTKVPSSSTTPPSPPTSSSSVPPPTQAPTANNSNPSTTTMGSTSTTTQPPATLPTLTEILNGRTVQAFNKIVNRTEPNVQTLTIDPKTNQVIDFDRIRRKENVIFRWKPVTSPSYKFEYTKATPAAPASTTPNLSNRILMDGTTMSMRTTTTMAPTTSTTLIPTTIISTIPTTNPPTTTTTTTTTLASTTSTTTYRTTTMVPQYYRTTTSFPSTTFFPTLFSTLLSTIQPRKRITTPPEMTITMPPRTTVMTTTPPPTTTVTTTTTTVPPATTPITKTTQKPTTMLFTNPPTTTTTTPPPPTTPDININLVTASSTKRSVSTTPDYTNMPLSSISTKRPLTEEQKRDFETLAQLEREQATILQQLAFLTNLNFGTPKPATGSPASSSSNSNLANRIIALAMERDQNKKTTATTTSAATTTAGVTTTTTTTTTKRPSTTIRENMRSQSSRQAKKVSNGDSKTPTVEELLKQLNVQGVNPSTPSTITSPYGKSNEAIIAAILKEQGIQPTTPKGLGEIYSQTTTTTKKPRPTTRPPGRLMQSLNWLLNVLAPPTTRRPKPKPKTKKPKQTEPPELLTHQPTHITPVVTVAPPNALSQGDIKKLIRQLESLQHSPGTGELDLSQIKSLQSLINSNEGVQVITASTSGTTSPRAASSTTERMQTTTRKRGRVTKSTTPIVKSTTPLAVPLSVSNSIDDVDVDDATTTARPKVTLPPLKLNPVPGIEDSDTLVRGNLVTAAVNVTRAISQFLGSALQGAANSFQTILGSGSRVMGEYMNSSRITRSG